MNFLGDGNNRTGRKIAGLAVTVGALALAVTWRRELGSIIGVIFGAAVIGFLLEPLCSKLELKLGRTAAAITSVVGIIVIIFGVLILLVPPVISQLSDIWQALPSAIVRIKLTLEDLSSFLAERGISLPQFGSEASQLTGIAKGTVDTARGIFEGIYRFSIMVVLGCFLLIERERVLLRDELLIPQRSRRLAIRMSKAVATELRRYVKGQMLVALSMIIVVSVGLSIAGVVSPLALGFMVGMLNIIPYVGPWLGGVPVVIMAIEGGLMTVIKSVIVIVAAQQLDGWVLSPRIMGGMTGISPALILVGIFIGSQLAGILGMLLTIPTIMTIRTLYRVFVQRNENN